jgi:Ca-activated chloride channel family protein
MSFGFAHPWVLVLLLGVVAYTVMMRHRARPALTFSRASVLGWLATFRAERIARLPERLRGGVVCALIVALAGPRTGASLVDFDAEGIALTIVLDISSSMLAEDFAPHNRLEVAKDKVKQFVQARENDRIGLVAFAGEALTQVPITVDYPVILAAVDQLRAGTGMLEDGTAIGTAIATGANRLRRAPGPTKVMILMTDGENNRGEIDPLTAARAASAYGIKIYTIGVGTEGVAPIPIASGPFGVQYANLPVHIDDELLTQLAEQSGGRYFRATSAEALDSVYQQIDRLEKSKVRVSRYTEYTPHYMPLVLVASALLIIEWLLRSSRWGRVP